MDKAVPEIDLKNFAQIKIRGYWNRGVLKIPSLAGERFDGFKTKLLQLSYSVQFLGAKSIPPSSFCQAWTYSKLSSKGYGEICQANRYRKFYTLLIPPNQVFPATE